MFLDTSGLLCLCNRNQLLHAESLNALKAASRRVTHSYVLSEFVALALARRLPLPTALAFEREVRESGSVHVIWVDAALHEQGVRLLEKRPDKVWTLCDAVSFVVMERLQMREALTTDHHFEQAEFVRLLQTQ